MERTRETIDKADLVLVVLDAIRGLNSEDRAILELIKDKKALILINKIDVAEEKIRIKKRCLEAGGKAGFVDFSTKRDRH